MKKRPQPNLLIIASSSSSSEGSTPSLVEDGGRRILTVVLGTTVVVETDDDGSSGTATGIPMLGLTRKPTVTSRKAAHRDDVDDAAGRLIG